MHFSQPKQIVVVVVVVVVIELNRSISAGGTFPRKIARLSDSGISFSVPPCVSRGLLLTAGEAMVSSWRYIPTVSTVLLCSLSIALLGATARALSVFALARGFC